jgi:uncharacterized protein YvpB
LTKKSLARVIKLCLTGEMILPIPAPDLSIFNNTFKNTTPSSYLSVNKVVAPFRKTLVGKVAILDVPFYSQFNDITSSAWQKVGCGVTSLAMVIEYYKPEAVSVDTLLKEGVSLGAYNSNAGWTHKGLITLSNKYGLEGNSYNLSKLSQKEAFSQFKDSLKDGPVIASVHYKFDPKSKIPHLVVINGIENGIIYYNDPAAKIGEKQISEIDFLKAWKKKFIVVRPVHQNSLTLSKNTSMMRS